jgi:hypothetical protein
MNQILFEIAKKTSEEIIKKIATSAAIGAAVDTTFALTNKDKRNAKSLATEFVCGAFSGAISGASGEVHDHFRDKQDKIRTLIVSATTLSSRYAFRRATLSKVNEEEAVDYDEDYDEGEY